MEEETPLQGSLNTWEHPGGGWEGRTGGLEKGGRGGEERYFYFNFQYCNHLTNVMLVSTRRMMTDKPLDRG